MINTQYSLPPAPAESAKAAQQQTLLQASGAAGPQPGVAESAKAKAASPAPDLERILESSSQFFQDHDMHLSFSVDESSGRTVVRVIDSKSSEVIRQIPSEEMLGVSRRLQQLIAEFSTTNGTLLIEKSA